MLFKKKFNNLDFVKTTKTIREVIKWQKERRVKNKDLTYIVPHIDKTEIGFLQINRTESSITWIGHSTFLIQMGGLNIITDPVWATRMGFGNRMVSPGIDQANLPEIDVVLISHNHYDHLDFKSLRGLRGNPLYLVPKGLISLFVKKGFFRVDEFKWWHSKQINKIEFIFVPAQHWSKRTLWDTNSSLWGGWIVKKLKDDLSVYKNSSIYFAGDSGYFRGFKEIGNKFDIEYALLPVGAYEPEWFMSPQHVTPEEAVQAYNDLRAKYFIPMHYEAFHLGDDTPKEALDRLQTEWEYRRLEYSKLKILKLGETIHIE